jgi:hypothetical protein
LLDDGCADLLDELFRLSAFKVTEYVPFERMRPEREREIGARFRAKTAKDRKAVASAPPDITHSP